MAETLIAPQFVFLVTSLISFKIVPLLESSGGARGLILAHGLPVSIINQDVNKSTNLMK